MVPSHSLYNGLKMKMDKITFLMIQRRMTMSTLSNKLVKWKVKVSWVINHFLAQKLELPTSSLESKTMLFHHGHLNNSHNTMRKKESK